MFCHSLALWPRSVWCRISWNPCWRCCTDRWSSTETSPSTWRRLPTSRGCCRRTLSTSGQSSPESPLCVDGVEGGRRSPALPSMGWPGGCFSHLPSCSGVGGRGRESWHRRTPPGCLLTVAYLVSTGALRCFLPVTPGWLQRHPRDQMFESSLQDCSPDLCTVNSETSEFLLFYLSI